MELMQRFECLRSLVSDSNEFLSKVNLPLADEDLVVRHPRVRDHVSLSAQSVLGDLDPLLKDYSI